MERKSKEGVELPVKPHHFPQRVVGATTNNLVVTPIWTIGQRRTVPKVQARKLAAFLPETLRKEVQQLYLKAPWKETVGALTKVISTMVSTEGRSPEVQSQEKDDGASFQMSSSNKRARTAETPAAESSRVAEATRLLEGCVVKPQPARYPWSRLRGGGVSAQPTQRMLNTEQRGILDAG